jgi:hypothetical protein
MLEEITSHWSVPQKAITASSDFASSAPGATTTNFCRTAKYREAADTDAPIPPPMTLGDMAISDLA